jgi:thioesterase domain-containing protein
MRDGLGDPNFHHHSEIRSDLANAFVHARLPKPLGWAAKTLASTLGYELALRDHSARWSGLSLPDQRQVPRHATDGPSSAPCRIVKLEGAKEGHPEPILLCCHAMDGTIDLYRALARKLADVASVYGIEQLDTAKSIPDLCAGYAGLLAEFASHRSLRLCGWSFGGTVAFELARQLREQGRDVTSLIMFDTLAFRRQRSSDACSRDIAVRQFAHALASSAGTTLTFDELDHLSMSQLDDDTVLTWVARRLIEAGVIDDALPIGELSRRFRQFAANLEALQCYEAHTLACETTLVRAAVKSKREFVPEGDRDLVAWESLITGGLSVIDVRATHYELMTSPAVDAIADRLRPIFSLARTRV